MTLAELFAASVNGFPKVESSTIIDKADSKVGIVTVIKVTPDGYKGCAVRFPGLKYDSWFYAVNTNDARKKYMKDLKLVK